MKASQRARFADESIVDQIIELDGKQRTGKYATGKMECQNERHTPKPMSHSCVTFVAKYNLEQLRMRKGQISKAVAAKKKADKKADISEEQA